MLSEKETIVLSVIKNNPRIQESVLATSCEDVSGATVYRRVANFEKLGLVIVDVTSIPFNPPVRRIRLSTKGKKAEAFATALRTLLKEA